MTTDAPQPLYRAVRCPRCKKMKITRYEHFRHCRRLHKTERNLAKDDAPQKGKQKGKQAEGRTLYTLEVSW